MSHLEIHTYEFKQQQAQNTGRDLKKSVTTSVLEKTVCTAHVE